MYFEENCIAKTKNVADIWLECFLDFQCGVNAPIAFTFTA